VADKSKFVDLISEATRQHRRRAMPVDIDPIPSAKARESRMAHTPPRLERWRLETLTPWKLKLKSWKFVNWD
jgi:hypothetical protein